MAQLFGFEIKRTQENTSDIQSFVPKEVDDGALVVSAGGSFGTYLDLEGSAKTEAELVAKYREMSIQPECELAIDDIVNECIVKEDNDKVVELNLDDVPLQDNIKEKIKENWDYISRMLEINTRGYEIFRRWYIDGRLYYHIMIDNTNPRAGIQEMRYVDPRKIRKVRTVSRIRKEGVYSNVTTDEFFMFNERGFKGSSSSNMDNQGLKITKDSMIHITSGIVDKDNKLVLGYLHKAIKPLNQLRILEDATVIYRISRAPERRIFYIDVGNLPKMKAEQYVRDMMTKHKNRLVYDATTGDIRDDRKFMTMLEDYWLPRRGEGRGTEISTLPSGQNLGELADVHYFEKKLYRALNVPVSRMEAESGFNMGRSSEITRDELKFQKFIFRLRLRFSDLFMKSLEKQLVLTGVMTTDDWEVIKDKIHFDFRRDNYFAELKDAEILRERLTTLQQLDPYVGKYYSVEWVKKNVLRQTDEDIEQMQDEMSSEAVTNTPGITQDQMNQQPGAQQQGQPQVPQAPQAPQAPQ